LEKGEIGGGFRGGDRRGRFPGGDFATFRGNF